MSLFRRFSQVRRLVASPQKSGAPNLRLFQPYLRSRQTSLSQPCSKLTGWFFRGPITTQRFCFWWWVKNINSRQIECTICTESKLASSCAALLLCSRCQQYELSDIWWRFSQVRRLVASPQKSGAPNLRLFQPYLRRRQTSLSQPCSKLTGVVFQEAL